ncbi:hypothetical protein E2C01_016690 [Portunus trituberculatus]|uniref:Uncharacterized protein n=1 Tax=Portunus trituberculatus TaxID=210409 RepID=A0A5B7DPQ9_PORTR|nr:hypothetical protein [Portunus trituberculatus]
MHVSSTLLRSFPGVAQSRDGNQSYLPRGPVYHLASTSYCNPKPDTDHLDTQPKPYIGVIKRQDQGRGKLTERAVPFSLNEREGTYSYIRITKLTASTSRCGVCNTLTAPKRTSATSEQYVARLKRSFKQEFEEADQNVTFCQAHASSYFRASCILAKTCTSSPSTHSTVQSAQSALNTPSI